MTRTAPSRVGEVWEAKPRPLAPAARPFTIVGWVIVEDLNARAVELGCWPWVAPGVWVALGRNIFGQPFFTTISEPTLRLTHRRVATAARAAA